MSKKLLVLEGNKIPYNIVNVDLFDRIILTSGLDDTMSTKLIDKVKTVSQYENELKFSHIGFEDAHNLIEQWKRIPIKSQQDIKLDQVLEYESISILDVLHSDLQIYYLSRIIRYILLVKKIIDEEKPSEITILNSSDIITKAFFVVAKSNNINVSNQTKFRRGLLNSNKVVPIIKLIQNCVKIILNKFKESSFKPPTSESEIQILFINYNRRNLETALPVYEELEKRNASCLFIQHGMDGVEYLHKNKAKFIYFDKYNNFKINFIVYKNSRKFVKIWNNISEDYSFQKHFIYNGIDCWGVFEQVIRMVFIIDSGSVIRKIEIVKNILNNFQPNAIVATGDRNALVRSVFHCARKYKTPTILLQYGNIFSGTIWNSPITADIMCVESTKDEQCLEKVKCNQGKIKQTGQPRYDIFQSRYIKSNKKELLEKYNIDYKKKIVLFTSVPYMENVRKTDAALSYNEYVKFLKVFYEATKKLLDIQFIVKPHPNENSDLHKNFMRRYSNNRNLILMKNNANTFDLIYMSDLIITFHSTSGLEAIILDKPLITLNITGNPDIVDYAEKGVAIKVNNKGKLCNAINASLYNKDVYTSLLKKRKKYKKSYLLDGKASERIVDIIEGMVKE